MSENGKLIVKLLPCEKCSNPFMIQKGDDPKDHICGNCKKLAARKKKLQLSVMDSVLEVENNLETSINEMKNQLTTTKGQFNKQFFLNKIKKQAKALTESIELIEKIEETDDESFVEEYQNLFQRMKKDMQ